MGEVEGQLLNELLDEVGYPRLEEDMFDLEPVDTISEAQAVAEEASGRPLVRRVAIDPTDEVRWEQREENVFQGIPIMHEYNRAARRAYARRSGNLFASFTKGMEYDTIEEERKEFDVKSKTRNKRLAEWSISARALKALIHKIVDAGEHPDSDGFVSVYKFGALYNRRYQRWFVYNKGTSNNIATIKVTGGRIIIRYRPNSFYSCVFEDINYDDENLSTTVVASSNMHRHNRILSRYESYIHNSEEGQIEFRQQRQARSK